jgi:hypothetical protein
MAGRLIKVPLSTASRSIAFPDSSMECGAEKRLNCSLSTKGEERQTDENRKINRAAHVVEFHTSAADDAMATSAFSTP